jgi:hypothetical protein
MINQIVSKWSSRAQVNWSIHFPWKGVSGLDFCCFTAEGLRRSSASAVRSGLEWHYYFPACSRYRSFLILGLSNLLCKKASLKNLVDIQIQEYVNRDERGGFSTSWLVFCRNPANSLIKNLFQAIHRLFLAVAVSSPDLQCLCRCC